MMVATRIEDKKDEGTYSSQVFYRRTSAPMVADRDYVVMFGTEHVKDGVKFSAGRSIVDERFPDEKGVVRMHMHEVYYGETI